MIELKDFPDQQTIESFRKRFKEMDQSALEAWLALLQISVGLEEDLNRFLLERELQQSRFFILILLMRHPAGMTLSQLARGIGVSNPTMTGLISRMERDGYVHRRDSPHSRREALVSITQEGNLLMEKTLPAHYKRISAIFSEMSKAERTQLQGLLKKIAVA